MKKPAVEEMPQTPSTAAARAPSDRRKLQAAIESVFRRTHNREMTVEERRIFGMAKRQVDSSRDGNSSRDQMARRGKNRLS
jgi:hypothetical protein